MTEDTATSVIARQYEVEQFLYHEARLLDERRYNEWYELLDDEIRYWMPTRHTVMEREVDREFSASGEVAHFDDDKRTMRMRIKRLATGSAWAENPPSRTRHFVTNVQIDAGDNDLINVHSNLLVYRTRLETEQDLFSGRREDILRRARESWQIVQRKILLDETVIRAKNLGVFF